VGQQVVPIIVLAMAIVIHKLGFPLVIVKLAGQVLIVQKLTLVAPEIQIVLCTACVTIAQIHALVTKNGTEMLVILVFVPTIAMDMVPVILLSHHTNVTVTMDGAGRLAKRAHV